VVRLLPALTVTDEDIAEAVTRLDAAAAQIAGGHA
jgi:acetylornithine/N-succinyldiaminopimelate aminotransferase